METSTWMSLLDSSTKLSEIVIPGSHDAGMSELNHCFGGVKLNCGIIHTQALNILQQLKTGSRYFDVRVDYDHRELVTYHRSGDAGCNGQSLAAVLDQSLQFIQSHRSETFILKFSHIRNNRNNEREIKDRIDEFLANIKYRGDLFTHSKRDVNLANITLDDCRGKIILVFDYPEHTGTRVGRFRYHDGFGGYSGPNITVCDSYSNTTSLEKMKQDQLAKLDTYGGLGKDYFFLLSWTLTPDIDTFFKSTIEKLAEFANPALEEVLAERMGQVDKPKPNIVYIDYLNAKTAQSIIQCNF
ncbi:phosphatidylinositol-specific phospholipase C domain-containing protein [Pedobacter sp. HMWF019]|uniref:phosphatidylinositol-specific phospholipase C domain-containing protein n=1 Tax=Pedobacter sp. HMWF019 TaxID=2056856 RepID=UPI0011B22E9E|nr:phosphatidylinositol-specific phospholipase C domain-containing protein [Pedobacter sp. HMWF019]